jgi:hypothetical protein
MMPGHYILSRDCAYNSEYITVINNDETINQANKGNIIKIKSRTSKPDRGTFKDTNFFSRPLFDRIGRVLGVVKSRPIVANERREPINTVKEPVRSNR